MASPQDTFLQGHPERTKDGTVLFCAECMFMTTGRLSSKEVSYQVTLVLTERAVYEFKGSSTKGKESKRFDWEDLGAVMLSSDKDTRFTLCCVDNSARTYETFTVTTKKAIVDTVKQRCERADIKVPMVELPEIHIVRVIKASLSKRASKSNVWSSLLVASDKNGDANSEPSTAEVKPRKSNLDGDWSAGGSSATGGGDRVGALGGIGPMTLIWRRLESAIQPHLSVVTDDTTAVDVIAKLKTNLQCESSPFSALGAPKDSASAMIALAAVMMDNAACNSLVKLFPQAKASAFLSAMESNLGCGDTIVRRWTALSLMLALPNFAEAGSLPTSAGWQQAIVEYTSQVRRRENAAVRLLFPPKGQEQKDDSAENNNFGGVLMVGSQSKEEKAPEKPRFGMLRVLTTKTDSKGAAAGAPMDQRKPSRLSMNFALGFNPSDADEAAAALEPSDRRIRGSLALVWTSRLIDLEASVKEDGIKKSDVQTMFQLLLGKYPDPNAGDESTRNLEFEVETFGATVESAEFFPSIVTSLIATRNDDVRCIGLKQINVLIMRNPPAIKAFLSIPDWQSVVLSSLYNVPFKADQRNAHQEDAYSYTMHLITTLHLAVLGSRSAASEFGPIDKLMGQTIYKIAVNSGWGDPAIAVTRSIFKGIISTLAKQATLPTCTWRHNPMNDEWEELFRLSHLLQTFLFYRPANMGLKDIPILVADACIKAAKGIDLGEFTDWRSRITFQPLLNRVQNERLLQAHRQIYAKLGLPVMTAAHRGDETGIHLDESGLCHDRSLVETAVKLWNAVGVSGNQKEDQKKSEQHVNKAERSRVMYASNVCRELVEVLRLFDTVDEKRAQVLAAKHASMKAGKKGLASPRTAVSRLAPTKQPSPRGPSPRGAAPSLGSLPDSTGPIQGPQRDQVQAIAQSKATDFLEKQKKKEANVGFLTKAKTKNQATNLRSNMLQKREVAIRKLGSGSEKLQPQIAATATIAVSSSGRTAPSTPANKIAIRADDVTVPSPSLVKPDEEKTIFEKETMSDAPGGRKTGTEDKPLPASRRTLVKLRKTQVHHKDEESIPSPTSSPPPVITPLLAAFRNENGEKKSSLIISRKRSRAPVCHGCDQPINEEVQEVSKFGHFWHGDCLLCSNCDSNILTKNAPTTGGSTGNILETCRYYPLPELLVCSNQCRNAVLTREGDARCPGCMDGFNKNEKTIMACNFSWHVDSQCFRCTSCEVRFDDNTPYFEVQGWPYCKSCLDTKFLHCKVCTLPLLDTDKVVEALDAQYHEKCFACTVCHEPFREDNFFRGEQGELYCFNHYLRKRSPPCASCHLPLNHKRNGEVEEDPISMAGLNFHRSCFRCSKCARKLQADAKPGQDDEPNEHGGQLFCPDCYVEEFGLRCRACTKGIRGDILHAGVGKHGETINWHPSCFTCDECKCPLLDVPFYLVTVGDDQIVPVCFDHYQQRYGNRKCPGCDSFVSPGRSRQASNMDQLEPEVEVSNFLNKGKDKDRRASAAMSVAQIDTNPAIMYNDAMWHARCLTCDEPNCNMSLFEEHAFSGSNLFRVETLQGKKYCSEHYESHLDKCFTCKSALKPGEERANIMGWSFHDTPACFHCVKCRGAIEGGQALVKLEDGPAHQSCPSKRKTGVWSLLKTS